MPLSFATRDRRPWRRRLLFWAVFVAALGWGVGFLGFVYNLPHAVATPTGRTDAIVVLTGGSQRLETGLELLARGMAGKLFVSGVHRGVDAAELLEVAQRAPGRLECCIVIDYNADDTIGNARETARWVRRQGVQSIRLVTAAYHMPRSLIEFEVMLPTVRIIPHPVFPPNVKQEAWYEYPGTAGLFAVEYTKYLLARLRLTLEAVGRAARHELDGTAPAGEQGI